jgi:hypothetical protein
MAKPKATPTLNYGISVTPSTTNVLPTYIKNWHINTADLVVSDQGTHATELAYIKSLNLHPRIDIEMVIWAGGQITDPLSDYESYLTSLKSAGWPNVASEGGRPGDASYLKSLGLGYVNYNCDQCGLWSAGAHTDPGTVLNLWESYYPSEVQYILQGASSGKPNGVLAGAWSDNGGDNAILTNSLNGGTPSYSSIIASLLSAGHTVTDFEVWCGTNGPGNVSSLGFDQVVATLQKSYAPNGNTPVPPTPNPPTPIAADGPAPAQAITLDGTKHFFARGAQDQIYHRTPATNWVSIGGTATSAPSAVAVGMDVYVFARGSDNKTTWYRTLTNPIWAPIGGIATSAPDATPNAAEPRISVVVRGANESLYCTDFNTTSNTWSPWVDYGGTII